MNKTYGDLMRNLAMAKPSDWHVRLCALADKVDQMERSYDAIVADAMEDELLRFKGVEAHRAH